MNIRFLLAVWCGKSATFFLRALGRSGGALPGLISSRIDPTFLRSAGTQCTGGIILVCGTNGKTTTSRMIAALLKDRPVIYNRSGSNLVRGHIAAFLEQTSWTGRVKAELALLEVDEAVLPALLSQLSPKVLVLHNLFRDQLDRYGEVNTIAAGWLEAIAKSAENIDTLMVNADDPNLFYLSKQVKTRSVVYYGIDDRDMGTSSSTVAVDAYLSPASGETLAYTHYYLSHLGEYDDGKGFKRPELDARATAIKLGSPPATTRFTFKTGSQTQDVELTTPGIYNIYNAVAALSVGVRLGIPLAVAADALLSFQGAFGRFEQIHYAEKEIILCLIKNPAGASEVLKVVAASTPPFALGLFANDNFADGIDVSWYWDTPYEPVANLPESVVCAGIRAADMALRLKYAGHTGKIETLTPIKEGFDRLLSSPSPTIYILSTYTATLELQHLLTARGVKAAYWEE